jgi:hypothetical protein
MLAALFCVVQGRGNAATPEYQVKAAFIYKFATYIRWPSTGEHAGTPFVIGVLGTDPFGAALDDVMRGQSVQRSGIVVRRLTRLEDALRCDVLFVSASERGNLRQILISLRGAPVLTIGDMDQFAERGGMVNLITSADNHIRFEINKNALDRAGLKAPSQLLQLAQIVDGQP